MSTKNRTPASNNVACEANGRNKPAVAESRSKTKVEPSRSAPATSSSDIKKSKPVAQSTAKSSEKSKKPPAKMASAPDRSHPAGHLLRDGRPVAQTAGVMALTLACTARHSTRSITGGGSPALRAVADAQANRPSVQELDRVLPPFAVLCQHLLPPRTPEEVVKDFRHLVENKLQTNGPALRTPGGMKLERLHVTRGDAPKLLIINDRIKIFNHYVDYGPKDETDIKIFDRDKLLYHINWWADAWENDGESESGSKDAVRELLAPLAAREGIALHELLAILISWRFHYLWR